MRDRDGYPPPEQSSTFEVPPDVQRRYQELQEEMRQSITLSPTTTQGESREERYLRRQRLRARRAEFERNARYPLCVFNSPVTIAAMIGAIVLLCGISAMGGALLAGGFNKQADISSTVTRFWTAMEQSDYGTAHESLDPLISLQDFTGFATNADQSMGVITAWKLIPGTQSGGTSTDNIGKATYQITRAGGMVGTKAIQAAAYQVTLNFIYNSSSGWLINGYGALFDIPKV